MPVEPWSEQPLEIERFREPPRDYGILPFWFLNGDLDPEEMRRQLREFRDKGMPGVILHGRYGLSLPYLGPAFLDRIRLACAEGAALGLKTWIFDEMNWPSGTAGGRVLRERPDLAARYLECVVVRVTGPWFIDLAAVDSRYLDFERSTPVAAFALGGDGQVIDLTPGLSFSYVIPWQVPAGEWRVLYLVEKRAEYYIDALDPEATAEFLRLGYEPYLQAAGDGLGSQVPGFYTDEPAMHYYLAGGDDPIVPWTKGMFGRFSGRNGYNLRPRLPDLFFDVREDSARVRHDFYATLTEFYSEAYFRQIHTWCRGHGALFTGHLLYEEWLRKMIRVAGNPFKHYAHLDVVGVDHLYPIIGTQDQPDQHVAIKLASSAAHQLGSSRLLCESFGGISMDATMQRMKWIADWEHALGVNLINPHGFHYTLEGPRKRDWPPSMFYQYPWWRYYGAFSAYMSRLGQLLSGGRHVARVAVLWPINAMFGTYTPQSHHALADRAEKDFNTLTDLLLRLHYDFDYLDEDTLAGADLAGDAIVVRDEAYRLLILPPMPFIKLSTAARLEQFVAQGGRALGLIYLPDRAFGPHGLVGISARMRALFGVDPLESQRTYRAEHGIEAVWTAHDGGGSTAFLRSYALARHLPLRLQREIGTPGQPEHPYFAVERDGMATRYWFAPPWGARLDISEEVAGERRAVMEALEQVLRALIAPDATVDNPEIFCLHRVKDGQDLYFFVNTALTPQAAHVTVPGNVGPLLWDPAIGDQRPVASREAGGRTSFTLEFAPAGSVFVLAAPQPEARIGETNLILDSRAGREIRGYGRVVDGYVVLERRGRRERLAAQAGPLADPLLLDGPWEFEAEDANALVLGNWVATAETAGTPRAAYAAPGASTEGWLPMVPGAWAYQLPEEPAAPYPIAVWYRVGFEVEAIPARLDVIVDGFAGADWSLYVNGGRVEAAPVRSAVDGEMGAVEITGRVREGTNVIALRLTVTSATDGLLDLLKITGPFTLNPRGDGGYSIAAPKRPARPADWTAQGYPFYSGRGVYRCTFSRPPEYEGQRVFLEAPMADDVLEVVLNGRGAGVRLWPPYEVEITDLLRAGENTLELRAANTLVNLLEAVARPSGLAGAPRLVPMRSFRFVAGSEPPTRRPGAADHLGDACGRSMCGGPTRDASAGPLPA